MWSISNIVMRALCAVICAGALLGLTGCMSDPHEGDLPWSPTATWEGSPFLPGGMLNER